MATFADRLDKAFGAGTAARQGVAGGRRPAARPAAAQGAVNWQAIQNMAEQNATTQAGTILLVHEDGFTSEVQRGQVSRYLGQGYRIATQAEMRSFGYEPKNKPIGTGGSTGSPAAKPEFDKSGAASIKNMLNQYGLDELIPEVDRWVRQGLTWAEIEVQLRDPSTKPGKVVDRMYPEIRLRREAGKPPTSIAEIQAFRTNAPALMRQAGMPEGLYDSNDDLTKFIVDDVSLTELRDRIGEWEDFGTQIAAGAGGELDLFERAYGVKPNALQLAALVLNPDKALPALRRQFSAVRLDVAAGRAGFGDLTGSEAERLADVGVDPNRAGEGFGQLADSKELFNALPGFEGSEDQITRQDQLGAVFEGNANARRRIERQAEKRKAGFGSGGAFAEGRTGFEGVGKAR